MTTVNSTPTPKMGLQGTTPATSTSSSLARRIAIEAALTLALFHVRSSNTQHSIQLATGRAIRAASMLKQACAESKNGGAA